MIDIIASLLVLFGAFVVHVFLHRLHGNVFSKSIRSMFVFVIGFILLCIIIINIDTGNKFVQYGSFPLSALFFYSICSILLLILYLPHILTAQTPADDILAHLQQKELTERELSSLFSEDKLLLERVTTLEGAGFIERKGQTLVCSRKGRFIWIFFNFLSAGIGIPFGG